MSARTILAAALTAAALSTSVAPAARESRPVRFKVRVENVAGKDVRISTGVWLIHNEMAPLFTPGRREPGRGLEALARWGKPVPLSRSLRTQSGVLASGVFYTTDARKAATSIGPGEAYEFSVIASPGQRFSLAAKLLGEDDILIAPAEEGIPLFGDDDAPSAGDVTARIRLWDAGVGQHDHVAEGAGSWPQTAVRASEPASDAGGVTAMEDGIAARYGLPDPAAVLRVSITPER